MTKLGFRSRVQIGTWVTEEGLNSGDCQDLWRTGRSARWRRSTTGALISGGEHRTLPSEGTIASDTTVAPAGRQDAGASESTKAAPPGLRQGEANTRWLGQHPEVVEAHRGQWLCIADEQLVGAETDWRVFAEKIKRYDDRDGLCIVRIPTLEELQVVRAPL